MGAKLLRASWGLERALVSPRQCDKDRDPQSWQKPPDGGQILQPKAWGWCLNLPCPKT